MIQKTLARGESIIYANRFIDATGVRVKDHRAKNGCRPATVRMAFGREWVR